MSVEINPGIKLDRRSDTNYDSRLVLGSVAARRNADLMLDVRVHFHRRDAGRARDGANATHTTLDWTSDGQFRDWVARFKAILERRLGGHIWLVPSGDWGVRVSFPGGHYRPNIKCGLNVIPVEAGQRKHLWLDCYRVNRNYCPPTPAAASTAPVFTSNMCQVGLPGCTSNYGQVVNVDIWDCAMPNPEQHYQIVSLHEFYHYLGFEHVAYGTPACPRTSSGNGQACYGGTPRQRDTLGGLGNRVEAWMYRPWRRALDRHLAWDAGWTATMRRPAPERYLLPAGHGVPGGVPALDGGV